jgi:hypothetical protein
VSGDEFVDAIMKNTRRYLTLFSQAIDKTLPKPSVDLVRPFLFCSSARLVLTCFPSFPFSLFFLVLFLQTEGDLYDQLQSVRDRRVAQLSNDNQNQAEDIKADFPVELTRRLYAFLSLTVSWFVSLTFLSSQ